MRGGRYESEYIGNTKDIGLHHVLGAIHGLVGAEDDAAEKWVNMGGKDFDQYDIVSMVYGGIRALQPEPFNDDYVVSECFIAAFESITTIDYLI